jgi:DNA polymerase I-like protein with 3'-5' exonuclease and polymerase domains
MNRWLKREKMKTSIIGQIHDSMLKHYHPDEIRTVILRTQKMIREEIKQAWPWIIVKLDADFEVGPVNGSWAEKKEYKLEDK